MLERLTCPHDVSKLSLCQLRQLASEVREIILDSVILHGGHLASNLGVVELTIALNYVFDQERDKILFDVGHQCYTHKILTGRAEALKSGLRRIGGVSGFPNANENEYDLFTVGHSGSSTSQAAGLAKARDLDGENYSVVSVVGDASLTTGLSFEALNNVGQSKQIIILNDNNMSISKNVGAVSKALTGLRANNFYKKFKKKFLNLASSTRGSDLDNLSFIKKIKNGLKYSLMDGVLFEEFGLKYVGPIDGHNFTELINCLNIAKNEEKSVLVHVVTKKGKGCIEAEKHPNLYHGVSPIGKEKSSKESFSDAFGRLLVNAGEKNKKVVAICAAMAESTGLNAFKSAFPSRFIDVGIAEEHAVTMSGGLARGGYKPYVAIYSSFLQRSYDQLVEDVALQNLPVTICVDRAGLVGEDGETHHGIFDLSMLNSIPNFTVLEPCSISELEKILDFSNEFSSPLAIRYTKGSGLDFDGDFKIGKWSFVCGNEDADLFLLSHGATMLNECIKASTNFDNVAVVNCSSIRPLDREFLLKYGEKRIFVIEDNVSSSSLGEEILKFYNEERISAKLTLKNLGSTFVTYGSVPELLKIYGLDAKSIESLIRIS